MTNTLFEFRVDFRSGPSIKGVVNIDVSKDDKAASKHLWKQYPSATGVMTKKIDMQEGVVFSNE